MKVDSGVAWISDKRLPNWMDIAREYTEYWLHQTHIREAVEEPLLTTKDYLYPFIQTYMLALPKTYKDIKSKTGTNISINVLGESGGYWYLEKIKDEWSLNEGTKSEFITEVNIDQDLLWRLFSKGIDKNKVIVSKDKFKIVGDIELGKVLLNTVSLIA